MAAPFVEDVARLTVSFTDGLENTGVVSHYVPLLTSYLVDIDAYYDAMAAMSNCAAEKVTLAVYGVDPTKAGNNAEAYVTASDKAHLAFQCSDGSTTTFSIPGPKDSIFLSDKKTVNPANALVIALVAEILALIVTKGGAILLEYLSGIREEGKPRATKPGVVLHTP